MMQDARGMRNRWEWPILIGLLLFAFFFRVWQLNDVPPGLHHDEVIIGQVAKDILRGHFAIYFTAGYGHEPLYHYFVAGMFAALGANAFVLRLTSVFIAMLGLATTYVFVRRIFSPIVAMGTVAWMSISLWPVFFARVGLRGILLPLLTTLTAYFLWRALFGRRTTADGPQAIAPSHLHLGQARAQVQVSFILHPSSFILSGVLLGLSIYTYQASRVFPLIFGLILLFVLVKQWLATRRTQPDLLVTRDSLRSLWRSVVVFFLAALIVAAPLIIYLTVINPSAESRIADLSGPLNQLRAGNPSAVITSTLNTLGMFTYRGDAVPIYNVSGRPVFPEILGAALFVMGLLICARRWKRPAHALMLIWFFISLIPAMVTPFSPNFVRTIAVWPVPFVFAGLAMVEIVQWVSRRSDQHAKRAISTRSERSAFSIRRWMAAVFAFVIAWNAFMTTKDYFVQWPTGDYVRFWQQATWTQAVRTLNADPSTAPIAASGLSIQDFDPQTFDLLGLRSDLKVKWFDCRNAILFPVDMDQPTIRYLSPSFFPCDADLVSGYLPGLQTIEQPRWPNSNNTIFSLEQFKRPWTLNELLLPRVVTSTLYLGAENFDPISPTRDLVQPGGLPDFEGLPFFGATPHPGILRSGATLTFDTVWTLGRPMTSSLKIFVHITAPSGKIVAQWDGLDVNVSTLDVGDLFVQRHHINLPADLPAGPYRISLGVYRPESGARLRGNFGDRAADSVVLGMLNVQ